MRNEIKAVTFLDSVSLLKYFLGCDEAVDTLITCGTANLATTDFELYKALGSVKSYDAVRHSRLVKLFENVEVFSFKSLSGQPKGVLTHETVENLRNLALGGK